MGKLKISAVIVSYNSEKFLPENLRAMIRQTEPFHRILVVDNNSSDNSIGVMEEFSNDIDILPLSRNCGYATAANLGIDEIKKMENTRYEDTDRIPFEEQLILVANSDIILDEGFNAAVLERFSGDNCPDMLSPLILRFDGKTVDSAGQGSSLSLHPVETGFNRPVDQVDTEEKPVFSVCGAATVFTGRALEQLKLDHEYYDEDFFMFWEDFDIGWRAVLLGLKTEFHPNAVVRHFRSGTLKKNMLARFSLALARPSHIKYHLVKNRYLTLIKNFRLRANFKNMPFIFLKDILWVTLLTFSSPKIIIPLMKSGKLVKQAVRKRQQIKSRENIRTNE